MIFGKFENIHFWDKTRNQSKIISKVLAGLAPINYFTSFSVTLLHRNTFWLTKNQFRSCFFILYFVRRRCRLIWCRGILGLGSSNFYLLRSKERIHNTWTMILLHYLQCPCACTMFFQHFPLNLMPFSYLTNTTRFAFFSEYAAM
jgi:hypothetical protein